MDTATFGGSTKGNVERTQKVNVPLPETKTPVLKPPLNLTRRYKQVPCRMAHLVLLLEVAKGSHSEAMC